MWKAEREREGERGREGRRGARVHSMAGMVKSLLGSLTVSIHFKLNFEPHFGLPKTQTVAANTFPMCLYALKRLKPLAELSSFFT